jgi:hypothetical protein
MAEGQTAAEAAGAKALGGAALTDRATDPAAVLGPGDKALSQKPVQAVPTSVPAASPLTEAEFRDKLMGMLLFGAFGDAFGAAHERTGLDGFIAADPIVAELRPYAAYDRRTTSEPFGVWPVPADKTEKGLVTDDTGVRVMLLHQWLHFLAHPEPPELALVAGLLRPNEDGFEAWLKLMKGEPTGSPPAGYATVLATRKLVIADMLCWFGNARRYKAAPAGFVTTACTTAFWAKDVPVVFGQFLYLELAAIYGCCDRASVMAEFKGFTVLDQGSAAFATGLLAAVLSQAIAVKGSVGFKDFFTTQVEELLADPTAPTDLKDQWAKGKKVGADHAGKPLREVLQAIKDQLYDPRAPAVFPGLGKFHPALFLAQMAAAVQYGAGKPKETLAVLAFGVGDADTIPAQLGSIIGAFMGETGLRAAGLGPDLDLVQKRVETYFAASPRPGAVAALTFTGIVDTLQAMAALHGCCRFP